MTMLPPDADLLVKGTRETPMPGKRDSGLPAWSRVSRAQIPHSSMTSSAFTSTGDAVYFGNRHELFCLSIRYNPLNPSARVNYGRWRRKHHAAREQLAR